MSMSSDGSAPRGPESVPETGSTPEVLDQMRAKLAEHVANLARASEAAKLVRGEAQNADRDLRVVLTSGGDIEELQITPSAMRHEPDALAAELKILLERARADVAAKVAAVFAEEGAPPITIGPAGDIDLRKSMEELGAGALLRDAERLTGGPLA